MHTRHFGRFATLSLALGLGGIAVELRADPPKPATTDCARVMGGAGMEPGMMGGMGPGMMGMGHGMMGGGMGHGMMGGPGMGMDWGVGLDLTAEQRTQINKIHDETRKTRWALMGELMDKQAELRDLYQAPGQDSAAIDAARRGLGALQQKLYETSVQAHRRMRDVLTKEQQQKLRACWAESWDPGSSRQ